jgi:hypothetical protein
MDARLVGADLPEFAEIGEESHSIDVRHGEAALRARGRNKNACFFLQKEAPTFSSKRPKTPAGNHAYHRGTGLLLAMSNPLVAQAQPGPVGLDGFGRQPLVLPHKQQKNPPGARSSCPH